ncbi:hypothetical protein ACFWNL_18430 [Kitasatospora sp. NPDC058397]|uniref:hypothetical protein n=1 Tax=unclassified Kitasatospora TaxID=2633591 RepID=UPI00365FF64E
MGDDLFRNVEVQGGFGSGPLGCEGCAVTLKMFELLAGAGPGVSAAPGACPDCGHLVSDTAALVGVPALVDLPPLAGRAGRGRHRRPR